MQSHFFKYNPSYCFILTDDGTIQDVNETALSFLEYQKEELVGAHIGKVFPPQIRENAREVLDQWQVTGTLDRYEIDIISRSGIRKTVLWSMVSDPPDQSGPGKHYLIFQDITVRKKKALQMKRLEALAHIGTWEFVAIDQNLEWSDETFRIFGLDKKDFIPTLANLLEKIHPDDRDVVNSAFMNSLDDGLMGYTIKHRITHGVTGHEKWVSEKCVHFRDVEGNYQSSLGVVQDITENENLSRDYEKFYQIVKSSTVPTVITDPEGIITFTNESCQQLYEYPKQELIGEKPALFNPGKEVYRDLGYKDGDYEQKFSHMWSRITNPEKGYWNGEVINRTKSGKLLNVYLFVYAIRDNSGKIISFVGTNIDISKEKAKEDRIRIETYQAIASLAEQRDNETGRHMMRIGEYSFLIAKKLGLSNKFCKDIRIFAPLHDIGKVGIPDHILLAPRGLTKEEFEIIKTHTVIGHDILKNRITLEMADEIAWCHQEKYDGSGYPRGLRGIDIPLSARICTIADVYDALRSARPYKESMDEDFTISLLQKGRGGHFAPELVDLVVESRDEMDRIFREFAD